MYGLINRFIHLYTPQFKNKAEPRVGIEPTINESLDQEEFRYNLKLDNLSSIAK